MRSSPQHADEPVRRARVLLGTLVEIALPRADATPERFAAAFGAVERVHALMSAHDPASDLARIARGAHRRAVRVDPQTHAVLVLAEALRIGSGGVFDVRIGAALVRAGRLPRLAPDAGDACGELVLGPGATVRATAPVVLDLSGIAKGYAVDRAVAALAAAGATSGIVNAGGDLRTFGDAAWSPVHVRDPVQPARMVPLVDVRDFAVATSAGYFAGALVDPRARTVRQMRASVTVAAPCCAVADALTKIVALAPQRAGALLARYAAQAWVLQRHGARLALATAGHAPAAAVRAPARAA